MTAQSFTPGPWSISDSHKIEGLTGLICHVSTWRTSGADAYCESLANAHLIASAPDLLVIAQRIETYLGLAGCDAVENSLNPLESLRFDAQKAIAKARGEVK